VALVGSRDSTSYGASVTGDFARWRSGALNTAHHAESIGRAVAAVPGSVHSANSAGCRRFLRDGGAVCVTDVGEIAELAGSSGEGLAGEKEAAISDHEGLALEDLILLDALPVRSTSSVEKLGVCGRTQPGLRQGRAWTPWIVGTRAIGERRLEEVGEAGLSWERMEARAGLWNLPAILVRGSGNAIIPQMRGDG
jgi:hypothetical protein